MSRATISRCGASIARAQIAELCGNVRDEDGDGMADCADPDCADDPSCALVAGENSALACSNDADDDGDGAIDCDDPDCALVSCTGRGAGERGAQCENELDDDADGLADCADPGCSCDEAIDARTLERMDPRRYPQAHVDQPLTVLSGMLVPMLGISARDDLFLPDAIVELGLGAAYGIFDFWEIAILPLPIRVSPSAQYEAPAISSTVRFFDLEITELGLYANVAIPTTSVAGDPERLPIDHVLARSRNGRSAELDVAILWRLRAEILRVDFSPSVTIAFTQPEVRADVALPLRAALQLTPFAYLALWTGVIFAAPEHELPKVALGFGFGTTIPGDARGPLLDVGLRIGWPTFVDPSRIGAEVTVAGWQITLDARVLTYLLP